jgi:uncharacterized protein (DUF983 family)
MMPWDSSPADQMVPDVPVIARNPATGEQVRVNVSAALREAIKAAITETVAGTMVSAFAVEHPKAVTVAYRLTDRTLMHGAAIDLAVAAAAVVATILSPDSTFTAAMWVVTAVLAVKTLVQASVSYAVERVAS